MIFDPATWWLMASRWRRCDLTLLHVVDERGGQLCNSNGAKFVPLGKKKVCLSTRRKRQVEKAVLLLLTGITFACNRLPRRGGLWGICKGAPLTRALSGMLQ